MSTGVLGAWLDASCERATTTVRAKHREKIANKRVFKERNLHPKQFVPRRYVKREGGSTHAFGYKPG
jgi:ATP-dependent Lon protease